MNLLVMGFFPHYNNLLYTKGHNPQLFIKLITYKGWQIYVNL